MPKCRSCGFIILCSCCWEQLRQSTWLVKIIIWYSAVYTEFHRGGVKSDEEVKRPYVSIKRSFALFFVSIVLYYVCMAIYKLGPFFCKFQIVSLIPLLLAIYFFFMFCSCEKMIKVFDKTVLGNVVYAISALTLDIYLVQYALFTDSMNGLFPLNIIITYLIIILYGVRFEMSVAIVFTNIWWRRFWST